MGCLRVQAKCTLGGNYMAETETYYLEYQLENGEQVIMGFADINDRDGCHISLDMYKGQLGPVDEDVLQRILTKFRGRVLSRH